MCEVRALNDGYRGSLDFNDGRWQAYRGLGADATIDLGRPVKIEKVACSFLNNQSSWIFLPVQVDFLISDDGIRFYELKHFDQSAEKNYTQNIKEFSYKFDPVKTRYIRMVAKSIDSLPEWHPGAGKEAWMFVDEIVVK